MSRSGEGITCRMGPSKWRPNHIVPTYFVSAKQRKGCFANINDAINFAQPFSRIELLPGRFTENVYLNKALEISTEQGQEPAEIVASSTGYAFTFATPEAFVEGICVKAQENALRAAVRVESGHPTIARCEFSGIEVSGDATPTVEECLIKGGAVNGIYVLAQAGGIYRSNKIENQGWFSIHVESSGAPTFLHNRIRSGAQGQVMVEGTFCHSNPSFQYNRITDENEEDETEKHTVYTRAFRLERLPVKLPGQVVNLMPQSMAAFASTIPDESDDAQQKKALSETRSAIVVVGREAMPVFQRNTVVGCGNNAFRITDGAKGIFEHNYVSSNDGWGFVVEGLQTEPIICGNSITCNGAGIKVVGSKARVTGKNEILDNRFTQLLVENAHAEFKFIGNEVRSGTSVGIHCKGHGQGLFEQNVLDQCNIGIRVEDGANPLVRENQFPMCGVGAFVLRAGLGQFEDNEFDHSSRAAVIISSFGNPTFRKCRMLSSQCGVIVTRRGRGLFDGCILKDNKSAQFDVYDYSNPEIYNCAILDGREEGISVHHFGRGYIHENVIAGNDRANVAIRTFADPIVDRNVLTKAHEDGLIVEDGGMGTVTNNVIERCKRNGIVVMLGANPLVRANHVSLCRGVGLHVLEGGLGTFEKNFFVLNSKANVWVAGEGILGSKRGTKKKHRRDSTTGDMHASVEDDPMTAPALLRNTMAGSHGEGLLVSNYAAVTLKYNVFSANNGASIKATSASTVSVCNCIFDLGQDGVVIHDDNTTVIVANNCFFHQLGASVSADLGAKVICCYNTFDQCAVGIRLSNSVGHVYENAFVRCKTFGAALSHMCKVRFGFNAFIECESALNIGLRCRASVIGNVISSSTDSGAFFDGEDAAGGTFEGNVMVGCHQGVSVRSGNAKISTNLILNCGTGIALSGGSHCNPTFCGNYVSCCDRGVLAMDSAKGRIETSLIGNCDIGVEICEGSGVSIRQSIIHNSGAIGLHCVGPCEGDVFETQIFKNFINVVAANEGAATTLLRCVLQAPTLASCFVTSSAKPTINRTAILSRAVGRDVEFEEAGDLDAAPKRLRTLLAKKLGSSKADKIGLSELRMPSLWDDLYAESTGTRIGDGFPASPDQRRPTMAQDDAATVTSATSLPSTKQTRTSSTFNISYVPVTKETVTEYPTQTVLEIALDDEGEGDDGDSRPLSGGGGSSLRPMSSRRLTKPDSNPLAVDTTESGDDNRKKAKARGFSRRSSILYPSNISDMNIEAAGPGGPLGLNRIIGADTSVGMRGLYTYMSSGVIIADNGAPTLESCLIRDHTCKEVKAQMRKRETATTACDGVAPLTPTPPAASSKLETSVRKRQSVVGKGTQKKAPSEEAPPMSVPVTTFSVEKGLFVCDANILLHRLLLVGSPAFYQRRGAPLPEKIIPDFFPSPTSTAPSGSSLRSADPTITPLTNQGALHLLGCGVLVLDKGKGVVSNCAFSRNNIGIRIMEGGDPLVKYSLLQNNNMIGVEILARGMGTLRQCRVAQNKTFQIGVVGPGCRPVISDTDISEGLVGMSFTNSADAEVSNCTVHDIGNTGVVVESMANPTFLSTKFLECMTGMEIKKGGQGVIRKCIYSGCRKEACVVDGPSSRPKMESTFVSESSIGLRVANGACALVTESEFFENAEHGVEVHTEASLCMSNSRVYDNCGYGIVFRDRSVGDVLSTVSCTNRRANFGFLAGSTPRVAHSHIYDGETDGIEIENSSPTIELCRIYSCSGHGITATGSTSLPSVFMCEIDSCEKCGVFASYGAGGLYRQLVVTNCLEGGILSECKGTRPVFDNLFIKANRNFAAAFRDGSRGELQRSILTSTLTPEGGETSPMQSPTTKALEPPAAAEDGAPGGSFLELSTRLSKPSRPVAPGLLITTGADPKVTECVITLQSGHGVSVEHEGHGEISDCIVGMCRKGCVSVRGVRSSPRLKGVTFFESDVGIDFENEGSGLVTGCLFLGSLRRAGILVGAKCSPLIEQCLAMHTPFGTMDSGHGRYSGCYFYLCTVGMELNGNAEVDDCETKDCSVGIQCTAATAAPAIRGTTVIQSGRMGVWVGPDGGSPTLTKCNLNRNRYGIVVDGGTGGSIESCELFNNGDCIVVNDCRGLMIRSNTVYDAQHAGIAVKGGNPSILSNFVFDCTYAGIHLELGEGEVEDNRAFFPREDGAIVQEPTSKANVGRNNVKNSWSPPQEKSVSERSSLYKRQEQDREKPPMSLRRVAKLVDAQHAVMQRVVPFVTHMASLLSLNPLWVVDDKIALCAAPSESVAKMKQGVLISGSVRDDDNIMSSEAFLASSPSSPTLAGGAASPSATSFGSKVFTPAVRLALTASGAEKKRGYSSFLQWRGPGNATYAKRVLDIPLLMGDVKEAVAAALAAKDATPMSPLSPNDGTAAAAPSASAAGFSEDIHRTSIKAESPGINAAEGGQQLSPPPALVAVQERLRALLDDGFKALLAGASGIVVGAGPVPAAGVAPPVKPEGAPAGDRRDSRKLSVMSKTDLKKTKSVKK